MATWTMDRFEDLHKILRGLPRGADGRTIEYDNSLPFTVWQEDRKTHPNVSLNQVTYAIGVFVHARIVGEGSTRSKGKTSRMFDPSKKLLAEDIEKHRVALREKQTSQRKYREGRR